MGRLFDGGNNGRRSRVSDTDTEILHIRIPKAMKEQIDLLTQATGRDPSRLAQDALGPYLAFEAEQLAKIHRGIREADAGHLASTEEKEAVFNRYRAYRSERAG